MLLKRLDNISALLVCRVPLVEVETLRQGADLALHLAAQVESPEQSSSGIESASACPHLGIHMLRRILKLVRRGLVRRRILNISACAHACAR